MYSYIRGRIEILYGDQLVFNVDEDGLSQVSSNQVSFDSALVTVGSNNRSDIAVRANLFIPLKWSYYGRLEADLGASSPAKPALHMPEPLSITTAVTSSSIFFNLNLA